MCTGVLFDTKNLKAYLEQGGITLTVSAKWSRIKTNTEYLHIYWNNTLVKKKKRIFNPGVPEFPAFHPMIIALKKLLPT